MEAEKETSSVNKKQIFVRNLGFDVTKEDLTTLFEEFGPLKNVSIAEKEGKPTGFGFVKFALEDDAMQAFTKLQGSALKGRKLHLDYGIKKENLKRKSKHDLKDNEDRPTVDEETPSGVEEKVEVSPEEKEMSDSDDHVNHSRQIVVFGIPIDVNKKIFKSVLQKVSRKAVVELLKEDSSLTPLVQVLYPIGKIMALTAASRLEANKIVTTFETTNLNNLGFAKYQASNEQGDDLEDDEKDTSNRVSLEETLKLKHRLKEKLICRLVSDITPPVIRKKKCRLIIRNLSFQATLQNVIDKMKKFGPIVEVEIPTESVEVKPRKGKTNDSDSPAIKEKKKGYAFVTYLCEKDAKSAVTNSTGLRICNREIAIDMCLSKGAFEKYGRKTDGADEGKEEDSESNEVEDEDDDGEPGEPNANADNNELAPSESNKDNNPSDQRKLMDDTKEGKTIFVYGLSYDTNSNDLQEFFSKYGKIEMALIVKDKTTGISKGSAFVKFASKDSVAMIFDDIAAKNKGVTGSNSKMLEINNRNCYINVAMNKEDLSVMKSSSKVGKDKRNLYLANEGIMVNNLNDDSISKYDKEKRIQSQVDKKKKLQNPIFFISENRLSIRNLSKKLSNNELKIACLKAVKNGISNNLVGVNDIKNFVVAQGIASLKKLYPGRDFGDSENQSSLDSSLVDVNSLQVPAFDAKNCVKQVKIMYDEKKIRDGKPQSRGYAFVEFSNHIYALAALRDLNNNPKYESISISNDDKEQKGRLIAEFTVENLRKVKILNERKERATQRNALSAMENALDEVDEEVSVSKSEKKRKFDSVDSEQVEQEEIKMKKMRKETKKRTRDIQKEESNNQQDSSSKTQTASGKKKKQRKN